LPARDWVKEAMLAAGNAAAIWAWEQEVAFPFASQEPPSREISGEGLAAMYGQRRSTRRATVSTRPAPHAGLGLGMYSQVTSPLRRYPDFLAHIQIHAALQGGRGFSTAELVERLGEAEQGLEKARAAESASRKHWSLVYLLQEQIQHVGGVLVERQNHRGTFLLPEFGLEAETTLNQDLPLNTELELRVLEVDLPGLTLRLDPNR
jgi:exoribonuclease-2